MWAVYTGRDECFYGPIQNIEIIMIKNLMKKFFLGIYIYIDFIFVSIIGVYTFFKYENTLKYWACLIFTVINIILWIYSRIQLGEAFSLIPKVHILVKNGIYSKIRNPIYISFLF